MGSIISILLFVGFFYLMMKYGCGAHVHGGGCGHGGHHGQKTGEQTPAKTFPGNTQQQI